MSKTTQSGGKKGELLVKQELESDGWHVMLPENSCQPNYDLVAAKNGRRILVQVKTNSGHKIAAGSWKHSPDVTLYNRCPGHPYATHVVYVILNPRNCDKPLFYHLPVDVAERIVGSAAREIGERRLAEGKGPDMKTFEINPQGKESQYGGISKARQAILSSPGLPR